MLAGARAEDQTATARPPVVRAVEFKNFHGVSVKEIVNRLNDRDIRLVERPYSAQYVATVQGIVEELMAEKGQAGVHVKPTGCRFLPHCRPGHVHRGELTRSPAVTFSRVTMACASAERPSPTGPPFPPS